VNEERCTFNITRTFLTSIVLFVLWMGLSGEYSLEHRNILYYGIGSSVFVAWLSERLGITENYAKYPLFILRGFTYVPFVVKEVILSNLAVTKIILSPKLPIEPTVFHTEAPMKTSLGLVTYANSITITPGTVSIDTPNGNIQVHAITKEMATGVSEGRMLRRVLKLEAGL